MKAVIRSISNIDKGLKLIICFDYNMFVVNLYEAFNLYKKHFISYVNVFL